MELDTTGAAWCCFILSVLFCSVVLGFSHDFSQGRSILYSIFMLIIDRWRVAALSKQWCLRWFRWNSIRERQQRFCCVPDLQYEYMKYVEYSTYFYSPEKINKYM